MITAQMLAPWCRVPFDQLESHADRLVSFRLIDDSAAMGRLMAQELVAEIRQKQASGELLNAIIPCGPSCWYKPFTEMVNREQVSLHNFVVYHMDECLDWQGNELPRAHPYSFRGFMEREFYGPVADELAVPMENRFWPSPGNVDELRERLAQTTIHLTYGGWGQDGHIAYNQARREPYSGLSIEDVRQSTVRIQYNNWDTIIALAQRTFGTAYQFVPPMSVTLGVKECLSAEKVRLWSDTGAWKQTALRVALFGPVSAEYPITLLQQHPDAMITATVETARHPLAEHPEWDLGY